MSLSTTPSGPPPHFPHQPIRECHRARHLHGILPVIRRFKTGHASASNFRVLAIDTPVHSTDHTMESSHRATSWSERLDIGKGVRRRVSRREHALWRDDFRIQDPIDLLRASEQSRIHGLLPLRYERMSESPFMYMRGTAASMASDVGQCPLTQLFVQACGDCHIGNFGFFASPERRLLFDITDFDETLAASWEFDVKRLTANLVLLAREKSCSRADQREIVVATVRSYAVRLRSHVVMSPLDAWYASTDSDDFIRESPDEPIRRRRIAFVEKTRQRTGDHLVGKLVDATGTVARFRHDAPNIAPMPSDGRLKKDFETVLRRYPESLSPDRQQLLTRYRFADMALKSVGVSSVGTRCGIALYVSEGGDFLILQVKEAGPSVLESQALSKPNPHHGQRVVLGQRLMQSASDLFLGWAEDNDGHHYYVRQLRDMKTSLPPAELDGPMLPRVGQLCGQTLARAHAKGRDTVAVSGYIGNGKQLADAMASFASRYADRCEKDFERFTKAVRNGTLPAANG